MAWREITADQNLRLAQKMLSQQGEVNVLRERAAAALHIHRPARDWSWQAFGCHHSGAHDQLCAECKTCHPCRTRQALTGEEPDRG